MSKQTKGIIVGIIVIIALFALNGFKLNGKTAFGADTAILRFDYALYRTFSPGDLRVNASNTASGEKTNYLYHIYKRPYRALDEDTMVLYEKTIKENRQMYHNQFCYEAKNTKGKVLDLENRTIQFQSLTKVACPYTVIYKDWANETRASDILKIASFEKTETGYNVTFTDGTFVNYDGEDKLVNSAIEESATKPTCLYITAEGTDDPRLSGKLMYSNSGFYLHCPED